MREVHIKQKLEEIGIPVETLSLGDFDQLGHFTAYKPRQPDSELYKKVGCYFRPNYERGLLIYSLIRRYRVETYLEIGFGRGYSALCAGKAMSENGGGTVVSVDPNFDKNHFEFLKKVYPSEWTASIEVVKEKSQDFLPTMKRKYDFIYIDGDHTFDAVKSDWENSKDNYLKFLLFDDYHKATKDSPVEIECAKVIDDIEDSSKELIIMDRRIFVDDRRIPDEDINYGQVLLSKINE